MVELQVRREGQSVTATSRVGAAATTATPEPTGGASGRKAKKRESESESSLPIFARMLKTSKRTRVSPTSVPSGASQPRAESRAEMRRMPEYELTRYEELSEMDEEASPEDVLRWWRTTKTAFPALCPVVACALTLRYLRRPLHRSAYFPRQAMW